MIRDENERKGIIMLLSMWNLVDSLKSFKIEDDIKDGKRILQSPRLFSEKTVPDDTTLYIEALANGNVRLFNQSNTIVISSCNQIDVINTVYSVFERYMDWSLQLQNLWQNECKLKDMLRCAADMIGCYLYCADATFLIHNEYGDDALLRSYDKAVLKEKIYSLSTILQLNENKQLRRNTRTAYQLFVPDHKRVVLARNLFSGDKHNGWIMALNSSGSFTNGQMALLDEIGDVLELWMSTNRQIGEEYERNSVFYQILNGGNIDEEIINLQFESLGWHPTDEKQVYAFAGLTRNVSHALDRKIERLSNAIFSLRYKETCILIANCSLMNSEQFESEFSKMLCDSGCITGRSPKFTNILDIISYFRAADIAARFSPDDQTYIREFYDAVIPYISILVREYSVIDICHPALTVLNEYDKVNNASLYYTLRVFLAMERSYTQAAKKLYIHRSTLLYRIERILELTSLDLDDPETRLYLQLSYSIRDIENPNSLNFDPFSTNSSDLGYEAEQHSNNM